MLCFHNTINVLVDGSCRSSSGRGFLELPSNNNVLRQGLYDTHSWIVQNVSGRTLVGLRFWNQARPFYSHLSYLLFKLVFRLTMMARVIGCLKVVM